MDSRDPFAAFFAETETLFAQMLDFQRGYRGAVEGAWLPSSAGMASPRDRLLASNDDDGDDDELPDIDIRSVPGARGRMYGDYDEQQQRTPPSSSPPHGSAKDAFEGTQGFASMHSYSSSTQFDPTTGRSTTIVTQRIKKNGEEYTCTQRFWADTDGARHAEAECKDRQGNVLPENMTNALVVGSLACRGRGKLMFCSSKRLQAPSRWVPSSEAFQSFLASTWEAATVAALRRRQLADKKQLFRKTVSIEKLKVFENALEHIVVDTMVCKEMDEGEHGQVDGPEKVGVFTFDAIFLVGEWMHSRHQVDEVHLRDSTR